MKDLLILTIVVFCCADHSVAQLKGNAKHPSWSPDGQRIAFSSDAGGSYDIYVMGTDGSNRQRVTTLQGDELWPSWMGDSVLVFDGAGRGKDNQEIYRVRLRDLKVTRLTYDSLAFDAVANVGPVSGRILFDSNRSIDKLSDVWVMERDGTNQRQLSNGANSYGHAAWSPDETRIAYRAKLSEKNHEIQLMNSQGTEVLWVSGLKAMSQHPSWSKDGNKLVFSSNAAGVYALYIFDLTTGNLTQVGFTKQGNLYRPSFSADGNSILYCEEKTKKWQVRLLDLKSGTARTLVGH